MGAWNFKPEFEGMLQGRLKRQTIRASRKDGRNPRVGCSMNLWIGMRTQHARKLDSVVIVCRRSICMYYEDGHLPFVILEAEKFECNQLKQLAIDDGFGNHKSPISEFLQFFDDAYHLRDGGMFNGFVYNW